MLGPDKKIRVTEDLLKKAAFLDAEPDILESLLEGDLEAQITEEVLKKKNGCDYC